MATTTNYSWSTPDDTALVKDGAAAIRSLGTAIDTTVFNNAGAAIAKTLIDAEGDLIVGDAADAVQRLAIGSNGNVLTVDTAVDGKIKWAAPAGGGKVLQVVSTTYGTQVATTSTSFIDSNLSLAITPSANTSKVLVFAHCSGITGNALNAGCSLDLLRGGSSILQWTTNAGYSSATVVNVGTASTAYLDSPATTSSTTYKVQFKAEQGNQVLFNGSSSISMLTLMEIGA
jgi:hypothetical protein